LEGDQQNLIKMKQVQSIIKLKNSTPIKISADNAIYDKLNYNTIFSGSVIITYGKHSITAGNADLAFEKNLATIYNNIIYKNLNTRLLADKMEMNLLTKNLKVSMNDKQKKVKIINLN
jgi:lipopolysaccharide export system protein LptA